MKNLNLTPIRPIENDFNEVISRVIEDLDVLNTENKLF